MRIFSTTGRARTRLVVLAVLGAALALSGAAKVGRASTTGSLTASISVLNDDVDGTILGQPTPGGNIGYEINISNGSTNTLNHLVFTDTVSDGTIVFLTDPLPAGLSCSVSTNTLSCSSQQMAAGDQFDVVVLFKTNQNGTGNVVNVLNGTYAPASNNPTNKRTDPTKSFSTTTSRAYGSGSFLQQSLLLPTPQTPNGQGRLDVGGSAGQTASVVMPPGFLNSNNYVGTTLQNLLGTPGCGTCLQFQTNVRMPLASSFDTDTPTPFWLKGAPPTPFQVNIRIPGGALGNFKPTGVWHRDDSIGSTPTQLANCAYDSNGVAQPQLTAAGICIGTLTQLKPSKDVIAVLWALSNGSYWIG